MTLCMDMNGLMKTYAVCKHAVLVRLFSNDLRKYVGPLSNGLARVSPLANGVSFHVTFNICLHYVSMNTSIYVANFDVLLSAI